MITVKIYVQEPMFFEVWQSRFLYFVVVIGNLDRVGSCYKLRCIVEHYCFHTELT